MTIVQWWYSRILESRHVLARVAKLSVERTTMAILPWLVPMLGSLVVITYVPSLVLWLPKMVYQ
jgi:TRAP-type C4-dicarboxylate transport system permease large subunit